MMNGVLFKVHALTIALTLMLASVGFVQGNGIPESDIVSIESALQEAGHDERSSVAVRRRLKNAARQGIALVESYPGAPNRFRVLGCVVQCQKRLLAMSGNERDRDALFRTCERLLEAPDIYARERLEADLLLSDRDLSARDASMSERAEALATLLTRYEGTVAEARSLLMAALIVQQLDAKDLEGQIIYTLDEKFPDDHEVIAFRRQHLKFSRLDLVFSGIYTRVDGAMMQFPVDVMGHMSLMLFWSSQKPGYADYLQEMNNIVNTVGVPLQVFSFNVDSLPDGGASILTDLGLDWIVMRLAGGRQSQCYQTYAQGDPVAVLVNEYGMTVARPEIVHGRSAWLDPVRISDARYSQQLQWLLSGEFLLDAVNWLTEHDATPGQAPSQLPTIITNFVHTPLRYRLAPDEAANRFERVNAVVKARIIEHDLPIETSWRERISGVVAHLGLWKVTCNPDHLNHAVTESRLLMNADLPHDATIIPQFCQALDAIRADRDQGEAIVSGFLDAAGGTNAPASALSAASVLALYAGERESYDTYRALFLAKHAADPRFYAFTSFLRDRHHQYRLLKANNTLRERRARGYIVGLGDASEDEQMPDIALLNLDGTPFRIPHDTNGRLTYLAFIEPPGGATNDFPVLHDRQGRPSQNDGIRTVMRYANDLSQAHLAKGINFVAAFLTDNPDHVRYLMATNGWSCQPVLVPNGLANPLVDQLGVLSADRFPNLFVLRRNGSIAWCGSGLRYQNEFGYPFAVFLALKVHIEVCEIEHAFTLLEEGDYRGAVRAFANPFPEAHPQRYGWRGPRYHGEALSYAGMQDWNAALDSLEKAIDAHKLHHFHGYGRRSKALSDWRNDAAKVVIDEPCDLICNLWAIKARLLRQAGRVKEADIWQARSQNPVSVHRDNIYSAFHKRLDALDVMLY